MALRSHGLYLSRVGEVALKSNIASGDCRGFDAVLRQVAPEFATDISPIEVMMGAALALIIETVPGAWRGRFFTREGLTLAHCEEMALAGGVTIGFVVFPQVWVGSYRADFVCRFKPSNDLPPRLVAIECDGFEYHDKVESQAVRDRARDRYFQSLDVAVLRYSGAEIWASPCGAAYTALQSVVEMTMKRSDAPSTSRQSTE